MNWQSYALAFLEASLVRPIGLVATAWLALHLFRIRHPASRHAAWTAVLIGMLLTPIISVVAPHRTWAVLPWKSTAPSYVVAPNALARPLDILAASPQASSYSAADIFNPATNAPARSFTPVAVLWCYGAGLVVMMAYRAVGRILLGRIVSRSRALRHRRLRESDDIVAPIAVGVLRPIVLLPANWRDWPSSTRRAVLAHEFAHLRRQDTRVAAFARVSQSLFWFHPLAWWVARHTTELAELSCDAIVVDRLRDPAGYSQVLVEFAGAVSRAGGIARLPGVAMASRRPISERIDHVFELSSGTMRKLACPRLVLAVIGMPAMCLAATIALGAQSSQPVPALQFAAASIRPMGPDPGSTLEPGFACHGSDGTRRAPLITEGDPQRAPLGRCVGNWVTVTDLIAFANGVGVRDVTGGPAWARRNPSTIRGASGDTQRFQIEAEAADPETTTTTQLRQMVQALLADRFSLVTRTETRTASGYALLIAKNGSKFHPVVDADESVTTFDAAANQGGRVVRLSTKFSTPLDKLADYISGFLGAPVVDKTGLSGIYDYTFDMPHTLGTRPEPSDISAALERQLGLQLHAQKVTVNAIVIVRVEKPSPN